MADTGTDADWIAEPLGKHHDRSAFSCSSAPLDRYLQEQAGQDKRRRLAAPFVVCEPGTDRVVRYYTLSAISIEVGELPDETVRRLPGYPQLPAILLGHLAIDQAFRGRGRGGWLLVDALYRRAYRQSETLGAAALVVDAREEAAAAFYEHNGFHRFPDRPAPCSCR